MHGAYARRCTRRDSLAAASAAPYEERAGEDEGEAEGALEGEGADGEAEEAEADGAEREATIREMKRLFVAYMPYKVHGHRYINDLNQPWLIGYRRHPFARDFFKHVDIDDSARRTAG